MNFDVNHPILFIFAGVIILVVLAQSFYFLIKAIRQSKKIGMDQAKIKNTIRAAVVFTIAPAISIVISVIALSKSLGLPLPWLRLSVIGSLSYEAIAANNALSAMGLTLGSTSGLTGQQYVNISLVMTLSILVGIWLVPLISKRLLSGISNLETRDKKWANILQNAMFIGMISAFVGFVFSDFSRLWAPEEGFSRTSGLIPVAVMAFSAIVVILISFLMKKEKFKWLSEYALPISMLVGMISAIPITKLLS